MNDERQPTPQWPAHLAPGALRFSYSSANYDATIAFYRDVVGLPVLAEFADSFGEDGTIFGLPSVHVHLEVVRSRATGREVDPLDQLVFYLSGAIAATAAAAPLEAAGTPRDPSPHPYWASRGATIYLDRMGAGSSSLRGCSVSNPSPTSTSTARRRRPERVRRAGACSTPRRCRA